jgi:flagellar protein FliS
MQQSFGTPLMNVAFARRLYRRTENATAPPVEDPHQIVLTTLSELETALRSLEDAQAHGARYPEASVSRSLTAIYILQSSLDFEQGEDIAANLFRLYEFCRQQVLRAFRGDHDAELGQARATIGEIASAWREIGPQARAGGE